MRQGCGVGAGVKVLGGVGIGFGFLTTLGVGVGVALFCSSLIPDAQLDHFLHQTPKLEIPVEMLQFALKSLFKQRIFAVQHDFHWFEAKFNSRFVKESESEILESSVSGVEVGNFGKIRVGYFTSDSATLVSGVKLLHSFTYLLFSYGSEGSIVWRNWNTSRSTAITETCAGSRSWRDQTRPEMWSLNLILAPALGRFSVCLASSTCLDKTVIPQIFWAHGRNNVAEVFLFGGAMARESGYY